MSTHNYQILCYDDLSVDHQKTIDQAVEQLDYSYAPYSDFNVGAGVLLEDGTIVGGSNQENASYPLCCCGERIALYHASAAHPKKKVTLLTITARNNKKPLPTDQPIMPCGACRQVIAEYEQRFGKPILLYLFVDKNKIFKIESMQQLLPSSFDGSFL